MAVVQLQQHHIKALTPTWLLVTTRGEGGNGGKKAAAAPPPAYSPLLLSPAVWQRAQDAKKRINDKDSDDSGELPASPRITCMGQVKGRRRHVTRGCSSARGPAPGTPMRGSRYHRGKVVSLVLGLLFGTKRNARTTASRASARVRDVPRGTGSGTASAPGTGSSRGVRRGGAPVAAVGVFDPPLPVVRRPAATADDDSAPSLWERRRCGRALEGLQLTSLVAAECRVVGAAC